MQQCFGFLFERNGDNATGNLHSFYHENGCNVQLFFTCTENTYKAGQLLLVGRGHSLWFRWVSGLCSLEKACRLLTSKDCPDAISPEDITRGIYGE